MSAVALVLPATSYRGPDFVAAASDLGIDLLVATEGEIPLPGGAVKEVVAIDCSDIGQAVESIMQAVAGFPVEAVIGVDDAGVEIAARVSEGVGLPHNAPAAVAATRDKAVMRRLLGDAGVDQPAFRLASSVEEAMAAAGDLGYPVVVKPRDLSASRGVIRTDGPDQLEVAFARIGAILDEAGSELPLLIEEFLAGPEIAVEALATPDGLEVLAVFDKPDPLDGPYFEETIYVTPSRHAPGDLASAESLVSRAVAALGLAHGPVHAEVRITAGGPRLVEVAARSIGGLCGRSLRFGLLGQSLETLLLRAALGKNLRGMRREASAAGVMMLPIPAEGVLREVRGGPAVAEVPGVTSLEITIPPGRRIRPLPEGDRYLGFLFAAAEQPDEVEAALREGHGLLEVIFD
jgi:biotin carboxylase